MRVDKVKGSLYGAMLIMAVLCLGASSLNAASNALLDIDDDEDEFEEGYHIPLFSLAALLGLLAGVTGMRNSTNKGIRNLIPLDIPRKFHRCISVAYYAVFLGTFALWGMQYYSAKGTIFHTAHGVLALLTLIVAVLSIVSGAFMLRRPKKWRLAHWLLTIGAYLLLLATIALGMGLDD